MVRLLISGKTTGTKMAPCRQLPRLYRISKLKHNTVKDFLSLGNSNLSHVNLWTRSLWNRDLTQLTHLWDIISSVCLTDGQDYLTWVPSKDVFSSRQCVNIIDQDINSTRIALGRNSNTWNQLWSIKVPPKISIFLWKLEWEILPTRKFLSK